MLLYNKVILDAWKHKNQESIPVAPPRGQLQIEHAY